MSDCIGTGCKAESIQSQLAALQATNDALDAGYRQQTALLEQVTEERDALKERVKELEAALATIAKWEFPATGRFWDEPDNTRPMSYGAAFGSNGERDYMRQIAAAEAK